MKNKRIQNTLATALTAAAIIVMMSACDHSFRQAEGKKYKPGSNTTTPATEKIAKVNIKPTVEDPEYRDDMAKATYRLYAARSANYVNGAAPNYMSESEMLNRCNGASMSIVNKNTLSFKDGKARLYNTAHPDYKYNFYLVGLDGATAGTPTAAGSTVSQDITVTGKEDIVIGFAYHSDDELDNALAKERNKGNSTKTTFRMLAEYRHDLLYSNASAMRNIQPNLHLKHVMTSFDLNVRARFNQQTPKDSLFRNVIITSMELRTPNQGVLTFVNDAWQNEAGFLNAVANDAVFTPTVQPTFIPFITNARPAMTAKQQQDWDFYLAQISNYLGRKLTKAETASWFHANDPKQPIAVANNFRVPRSDSYQLRINYYYVNRIVGPKNAFTDVLDPTTPIYDLNGATTGAAVYNIMPPDGVRFVPGGKYAINVDIYGLENISVDVKKL